jgi:hypothetical protein
MVKSEKGTTTNNTMIFYWEQKIFVIHRAGTYFLTRFLLKKIQAKRL